MATPLAKSKEFPVNSREVDCLDVEVTTRTLSARDSHALLDLLESDPEPTKEAVEAFARYRKEVRRIS